MIHLLLDVMDLIGVSLNSSSSTLQRWHYIYIYICMYIWLQNMYIIYIYIYLCMFIYLIYIYIYPVVVELPNSSLTNRGVRPQNLEWWRLPCFAHDFTSCLMIHTELVPLPAPKMRDDQVPATWSTVALKTREFGGVLGHGGIPKSSIYRWIFHLEAFGDVLMETSI